MSDQLKRLEQLEEQVKRLSSRYNLDIAPGFVKQQHIDGVIIYTGLAADRPDGSTEVKAYFSTDTDTLNIWNGTAWVQQILT